MGFLGKLFSSENDTTKKEIVAFPWHLLTSREQLDLMETESENKGVVIFKHSTRCGISRMVLKRFEKEYDQYDLANVDIKLYLLDLLHYRELSGEIASRYNVVHESPQLLVLRDHIVVHQASHQGVSATELQFV